VVTYINTCAYAHACRHAHDIITIPLLVGGTYASQVRHARHV